MRDEYKLLVVSYVLAMAMAVLTSTPIQWVFPFVILTTLFRLRHDVCGEREDLWRFLWGEGENVYNATYLLPWGDLEQAWRATE